MVEAAGITMGAGPVGMPTDADGLRLQLLGVPGGLAKTIIPAYRVNQDEMRQCSRLVSTTSCCTCPI